MASGLISHDELQQAYRRLSGVLSGDFLRHYFGRDRLNRLARIVGGGEIDPIFLLMLLLRQQGPGLLAERPRRIGNQQTSVRRKLLEALPEGDLKHLFERVRCVPALQTRVAMERDLTDLNWFRGSATALRVTRALGLPDAFAGLRQKDGRARAYEIEPIGSLPPLKPYQRGLLREVRSLLEQRPRAMVSSFTGTGKTRLGMEYVVDQLLADEDHPLVLWVAQKGELLDQACEAIEQLWPWRGQECGEPLQVLRFCEGSRFDEEELAQRPTLVVASSQQMAVRIDSGDPFATAVLRRARLVVVDEAHHALARGHKRLVEEYERARQPSQTRTLGLTATPGRSNLLDESESRRLAELFGRVLVVPRVAPQGGALAWFQREGYLSEIRHRSLETPGQIAQTLGKLGRIDETDQTGYRDFTPQFLGVVGEDSARNRFILQELVRLHAAGRHMLVFCCNITQAELLAQALIVSGTVAGLIHHQIDARDRHHTVALFRRGEIRILFNVEVLTTGFDAPKVDTIVMCRPTLSRVLYEQMVGRGMRGPKMGGTELCEIVDFTTNFGNFQEPQAWEAFWSEWALPESEDLPSVFGALGWSVVAAEPEAEEPTL
jgi:DNA repair protein RadD